MPEVEKQENTIIEGMTEDTARKYVEFRKRLDTKLIKIGRVGKLIYYASRVDDEDLELCDLGDMGELVYEMIGDTLEELDIFIPDISVHFKIMEIDNPEEHEKLPQTQ